MTGGRAEHARLDRTFQQLRQLREKLGHRRRVELRGRRAEDHFRDEHHDAHATTIRAGMVEPARLVTSTIVTSRKATRTRAYSGDGFQDRMRIRITKTLPAPLIDGFDVRGLRADHIYDVDLRTGNYLIVAGYAVQVEKPEPEPGERRRR